MWSVGCIFAELMQRSVLFPSKTNADQVKKTLQFLMPDDDDLEFLDNDEAKDFV
jgi:mitogen-activated protein kinase 1/3